MHGGAWGSAWLCLGECVGRDWCIRVSLAPLYHPDTLVNSDTYVVLELHFKGKKRTLGGIGIGRAFFDFGSGWV